MQNEKILWQAGVEYIDKRLIPIMQIININQAVVLGTGFFIEHKEKLFLCTAAHVINGPNSPEYSKIAIPVSGPRTSLYTLPASPITTIQKGNIDADIALIPLFRDKEYCKNIKMYWDIFCLNDIYDGNNTDLINEYLIQGYPVSLQSSIDAKKDKELNIIDLGRITFLSNYYDKDMKDVDNYNKEIDILINYKNNIIVNGENLIVPDLHGISGSPIFCMKKDVDKIWTPQNSIKIFGIQKSVKEKYYIKGTKAKIIKHSIEFAINH